MNCALGVVIWLIGFLAGCGGTTSTMTTAASSATATEKVATQAPTPLPHSVMVSWQASDSTGVGSYNVYRSTVSGGPYTRISSGVSGSSYRDPAVQAGVTYFYVVTAVTNANVESRISQEIKATVPSP